MRRLLSLGETPGALLMRGAFVSLSPPFRQGRCGPVPGHVRRSYGYMHQRDGRTDLSGPRRDPITMRVGSAVHSLIQITR